jgi:hypothetical protein
VEDRLMRLRRATSLEDFEPDDISGFGDRETRAERREARRQHKRQRRQVRRERRLTRKEERKLGRVARKQQKVRQKLASTPSSTPSRVGPSLQPAPQALPVPSPRRPLADRAVAWVEELIDEGEEPLEEELEDEEVLEDAAEATEGLGAVWSPFRQPVPHAWGPSVPMGRRLRIQAALGHRAAVIELKPGLFLVAEMPEALMRTEFGLAPVLAPMMMTAARRSMDEPGQRRGPFARLFRRRQREEPVRYVQVVQAAPQAASLALPGPVEEAVTVVPAPNVGWADDATVAAAYGCQACPDRGRR